jgi:biopolymer transport protein ExbD
MALHETLRATENDHTGDMLRIRRPLRWVFTIALVVIAIALGIRRTTQGKVSSGLAVGLASSNCSVELMPSLRPPLRVRLLADGNALVGSDTLSRQRTVDLLSLINRTRPDRLLLLDADDTATFQETAVFFNDVGSVLPNWRLLLLTRETRQACEQLIEARSVPAS